MISLATTEKLVHAQGGLLGIIACSPPSAGEPYAQFVGSGCTLGFDVPRYKSAYAAFLYESNAFRVHLNQPGEEVCIISVNRETWCRGHRNVVATGPMASRWFWWMPGLN